MKKLKYIWVAGVSIAVAALILVCKNRIVESGSARIKRVELVRPLETRAESFSEAMKSGERIRVEQQLRDAFFKIEPSGSSEESLLSIEKLKLGLHSKDEEIKGTSAALVQSLLIDVGHNLISVDSTQREALEELFRVFSDKATDVVERMKQSNAKSPALAYLNKINENRRIK